MSSSSCQTCQGGRNCRRCSGTNLFENHPGNLVKCPYCVNGKCPTCAGSGKS